jgi:predicted acyltransferase
MRVMQTSRISSIDLFRGLAILTMVLANFMGGIKIIPPWLKHAPDVGLTVIDFIAPFFIFAIGLTYGPSFHNRLKREGALKTYSQFFTRYLAILGMGALISSAGTVMGVNPSGIDWGVLQSIGAAGLITLSVIRLSPAWRWGIGLGLLVVYQWILDHYLLDLTLRSPHGGLYGSVAWGAMLILATVLADLFHDEARGRRIFPWASLATLLLGIGLAFIIPVSKHRVSASYVLITLGVSALLFYFIHWLVERLKFKSRLLEVWGKNPLTLYFLHYILIGLVFLPGIAFLYTDAPLWLVLLEIAGLMGGISAVAFWLDRRNLVIRL